MMLMNAGTKYKQNDIVLLPFPYTNLEGIKLRPALIISNKKLNSSQDRICCLITSNTPQDGIEIQKRFLVSGSLPFQSWVKPHRLFTIHEGIIKKKLCMVNSDFHDVIIKSIIENLKKD